MRTVLNIVRSLVWIALAVISIPVVWQAATGGSALTVTGSSMVPTYERGDIVFVKKMENPSEYSWRVGDVVAVAFSAEDIKHDQYIHRVAHTLDDGRAVLKGDGNSEDDVSPVVKEQIVGVPVFALHGPLAHAYPFTQAVEGRASIIAGAIGILLVVEMVARWSKRRKAATGSSGTGEQSGDSGG